MAEIQVVYIDILFLTNFIINCALILCTARLMSLHVPHGRAAAASALGGIYSVCMFFPSFSTLAWMGLKFVFAVSIVVAAFGFKNINRLLRCTAAYLAVNFLFGGAAFALYYFTPLGSKNTVIQSNGVFYLKLSLPILLLFCAVSYVLLNYALYIFKSRARIKDSVVDIRLSFGGKSCMLRALSDTGNMLKSPVEQKPVIICELSALSDMLDASDSAALSDECCGEPSFGVLFLPYTSLGAKEALIPAFFADEATYYINKGEVKDTKVLVAVSRDRISQDGSINALVNPSAFERGDREAEKT
ncbi:MAG: sigma-E processing peptidase SpoIIGA [Clostridia bacterium]|nr:sigma-E processing peptidase SpoIIGA [Clostridia bacterium]